MSLKRTYRLLRITEKKWRTVYELFLKAIRAFLFFSFEIYLSALGVTTFVHIGLKYNTVFS